MRLFRNFVLLIGMTLIASPAGAVSLKKCRKLCKPLTITIKYSIVTAGAATQVSLDPASFGVLDQDTDVVYPAAPAAGPDDCSAALVVAKSGPPVTCTLRFHLPRAVGDLSSVGGGQHAELQFESHGLHGGDVWSY
jgi:hypothetical protein